VAAEQDDPTVAETPSAGKRRALTEPPPERYQIVGQIGEGGMGRVYRARDTTLGRDVAIKLIESGELRGPDRTQQRERFVREARAAARLLHPNIAVVHDVDPEAGWLVMELVEGESLRDRMEKGRLEPALVARVAAQVLAALECAHAAGVIHRDIKPSNIMIGADDRVKLVDFGVARLVDVDVTRTGDQVGTPAYMAPEQVRGAAIDARTDLYSLGATLYELVVGERMAAFESPTPATLAKLDFACAGERGLAAVIARCLQADPDARFRSAGEALATLSRRPAKKRRWWIPAAAVMVGVVAGGGAYFATHRKHARDPRVEQAFELAQRGENEKAVQILQGYTAEHPDDADALTIAYLAFWWQGGDVSALADKANALPLPAAKRAMIGGIDLIRTRRETEAIAYLQNAARETPDAPEILYALGEAQWHGEHLEDGATTLEHAFMIDPRWQMALHHVVEYRLSRGEAERVEPIAKKLHEVDPSSAAALDCKIAVSKRDYAGAAAGAQAALASPTIDKIPEIYICLAQAQALAGDLRGGEATAKTAFELWPIDYREWGGFAQYAEFFLYRRDLDGYLDLLRGKPSRQRAIALMMWRPAAYDNREGSPIGPGMREPPLGASSYILQEWLRGNDTSAVWSTYPEPEVRAWGLALAAEKAGDKAGAIAHLREALAVPSKGDTRMLLAHRLAKLLHETGDDAGAKAACDEVIRPRVYINYRAVLLPDCVAWSGGATQAP
jgi:tRNA A-37 threonylcarbamoyl transferase component Bud32/tetratricopeptide (TPR) repeat protein